MNERDLHKENVEYLKRNYWALLGQGILSVGDRERLEALEVTTLHNVILHDRSLAAWHKWLTTDIETGEPTGHLQAPASRYGRNGDDCAWFAIACEVIYANANGAPDDPEASLDFYQGLVVNDHDDVARLVIEYYFALPDPLRAVIGTWEEVKQLKSTEGGEL